MAEGFRSLRTLSLIATIGLALMMVMAFLDIAVGAVQIFDPDAFVFDETDEIPVWLIAVGLFAMLQFPLFLGTVVVFLMWEYRAHSNLRALKAENVEFTPGWAVGWWFIPILNLFKPFQVMREIWCESDPESVPEDGERSFLSSSLHSAPGFMTLWWAFWLLSNFLSNIASNAFEPERPETALFGGTIVVIAGVFSVIAAILAILVVRDITDRQEKRSLVAGQLGPAEPPPPPTFAGEPVDG